MGKLDEYFVQEKTSMDKLLDFLVFIAVFVVTIFLILDIIAASGKSSIDFEQLQAYYLWANFVIFVIFLADLIRLWAESHGAKDFFNIIG